MNKLFLIVSTFFLYHATAQQTDLLEDFEDENSIVLSNWNGELQSERVENPSPDTVNSSAGSLINYGFRPEQIGELHILNNIIMLKITI